MVRRILLHTDTTEVSEPAMQHARGLAEAFGASVDVLHIPGEPLSAGWTAEVDAARLPSVHEAMAGEARQRLNRVFRDEDYRRFNLNLVIETGAAAQAIVDYARRHAIDVVVIGARGYPDEGAELDEVARDVVEKAPCSVLVVRPPAGRAGPENGRTT